MVEGEVLLFVRSLDNDGVILCGRDGDAAALIGVAVIRHEGFEPDNNLNSLEVLDSLGGLVHVR